MNNFYIMAEPENNMTQLLYQRKSTRGILFKSRQISIGSSRTHIVEK